MQIALRLFFIMFLMVGLLPPLTAAQAAGPNCDAAAEGVILYNKTHKVVQFCNGTDWIGMAAGFGGGNDTLAGLSCASGEIAKWNGTTWACAADASGMSGLPALNSANIWVGNGSNAATAVAMSGDATLSNTGVLTIGSNAIGSAEITNASVAIAELSATGTPSATTYLRGDNTWATIAASTPGGLTGHVQFNSSGAFAGDNGLFWDNANKRLGIGATAPVATLHVAGGNIIPQLMVYGNSSQRLSVFVQDGLPTIYGYDSGAGSITDVRLNTAVNPVMIKSTGNVGIGTDNPGSKLEVVGNVAAATFSGSGASLTALNATNLASGTVSVARLPAYTGDVTKAAGATALTIAAGAVTATELANDAVTIPKLAATGTASASTFLRGDNTWAAPSVSGGGASYQSFTTVGTATWTKPGTGAVAFVECWGGGGSGGRYSTAGTSKGGGGGGGYSNGWFPLAALPGSVTVTTGAGGAAKSSNADGSAGGNSSFGNYVIAYGGGGGDYIGLGGGGGGPLSAGSIGTPGQPLMLFNIDDNNGQRSYVGGGGTSKSIMSSITYYPAGSGIHHGGGGGGGPIASTLAGGKSAYGGGGGGGRSSSINGAAGISQIGGSGGAGGVPGGDGQQPGGGGGGSTTTSGKGGDGQCNVTVF